MHTSIAAKIAGPSQIFTDALHVLLGLCYAPSTPSATLHRACKIILLHETFWPIRLAPQRDLRALWALRYTKIRFDRFS